MNTLADLQASEKHTDKKQTKENQMIKFRNSTIESQIVKRVMKNIVELYLMSSGVRKFTDWKGENPESVFSCSSFQSMHQQFHRQIRASGVVPQEIQEKDSLRPNRSSEDALVKIFTLIF